jgi:hypothetical protein
MYMCMHTGAHVYVCVSLSVSPLPPCGRWVLFALGPSLCLLPFIQILCCVSVTRVCLSFTKVLGTNGAVPEASVHV